jgi:hypothetical protein
MSRRLVVVAAATLLCFASAPHVAVADGLNPPLVGMHEVSDAGKMVSISLPELVEAGKLEGPSMIALWGVKLYADPGTPHLWVRLSRKPAFARAALHASQTGSFRNGALVDGSVQSEAHRWQELRVDATTHQYMTYRMIEHGGEVFEAMASCTEKSYPIVKKHIEVILDTFKGVGPPLKPEFPAGFKMSAVAGRELWTDAKSKSDIDHVLALHSDSWDRMKTILPASFAMTGDPRVVICKDEASYAAIAKIGLSGPPPTGAFVDVQLRALVVCVSPAAKKFEFDRQVQRCAGVQCAEAAYGGGLPYWFEQGLSVVHLFTTGKGVSVEKPNPAAVRDAKAAFLRRPETLKDLLDHAALGAPDVEMDIDRLMWTWTLYLREHPATDEGGRYKKYAETIEQSGDVAAARAVWEGADFAAMKTAMGAWLASK